MKKIKKTSALFAIFISMSCAVVFPAKGEITHKTPEEIARMTSAEFAAYNKANDLKSQKACKKLYDRFHKSVTDQVVSLNAKLRADIESLFQEHKILWKKPSDAMEALESKYHADFSSIKTDLDNIQKVAIAADCGESKLRPLLAIKIPERYTAVYARMTADVAEMILKDFLKCPEKLTDVNIADIAAVQRGDKPNASISVHNAYYPSALVIFSVDPSNKGNEFSKNALKVISKNLAINSNNLDWKNIITKGDRTYCPYKWSGKVFSKNSSIYYKNK